MIKQVMYRYLGTNGTLETPIHLEDIYYTRFCRLFAEPGMKLTKDNKTFFSMVRVNDEEELPLWHEVDEKLAK
jgi:hypothetical protein